VGRGRKGTAQDAPAEQDAGGAIVFSAHRFLLLGKDNHTAKTDFSLCARTLIRQVVAYAIGDRSKRTCRKLWEAIPSAYRIAHCYSDFWKAYSAVIPANQHTAVGIRSGQTAHVERLNNRLRQRMARLVRQTLSFSKSEVMHEACLGLFLHRYNQACAATFR